MFDAGAAPARHGLPVAPGEPMHTRIKLPLNLGSCALGVLLDRVTTCLRLLRLLCAHQRVAVASLNLEAGWLCAQVRCIAAVLLLVGRGLEAPSVVARLLDVPQLPAKPQYCLAPEVRAGPCFA